MAKYKIRKSRVTGKWRVVCLTYGTCPLTPSGLSHYDAIEIMDNHQWVWHSHKESNGSTN